MATWTTLSAHSYISS